MLADAVRPRLIKAGADLGKVYALCQLEEDPLAAGSRPEGGRGVKAVHAGGVGRDPRDHWDGWSGDIAADADSVACGPSLRSRISQWNRDLPVLEAELQRLRASGVAVSMMVIDPIDGFVDGPCRRSLVAADVEKLAELARKFQVAIVLAANMLPAAMLRSNRARGMAGINAIQTVARTVWMIDPMPEIDNLRVLRVRELRRTKGLRVNRV